jgi:hypothetical protein
MRDAMGVEVLSKAETKKVEKKWNEKEAARRDFEKMRDEVSDLERRLVAAETLAALSKSRSKSKKHTKSARSVADTIRGLKSKEEKTTIKDEYGNDIKSDASTQGISMNDLIEMVALAVERVGKLADAIVDVKTNLKGKDWYKNLSGEKKDSINKQLDELEAKSKRAVSRSNRDIDFETFNEGINKENLKDVNSLIGDQVDAGIKGLDAVLKNVTEIIGSEKVKESDILDVLNGSYAEKKIRSQLSVDMSNLRTEAKLLKEIDRILSGEAKPQSEMKVKTRQHLLDLKLKVQNLRKDIGELDIAKIDAGIKRNKKEVERLQERMDTQSFYPEKRPMLINNKEIRKRHPKEMKSLDESADVLHDKRLDLEIMRMDAEKKRRSFPDKIRDAGYEAIRTSAMTVAGVMDYSVAGVHLAPAMFESPLKFVKNFAESIPESLSPKKYRQAVLDMKMNKEFYELAEKSEVAIIDLDLISEGHNKHSIEMQLGKTAYDRMKFSRKMDKLLPKKLKGLSVADVAVKPFQRHFVSMGNKMRLDMFADKIKGLVKEGKTFESHPAEYKKMAMIVNALSGRSKLDASFKNDLVTYGVWSPPKWASALNLLGVSDAYAMFKKENKGFYNELVFTKDKAVRKEVLKSVVSMYMTDQVITGLAKLGGAYVDDDPLSVFYGHIIFPATEGSALKNDFHWDRGNFVYSTLRGINQMIAGEVHREGKVVPTDASKIIPKMLRGKTTPISGSAINLALGKDYIGKKATLKGEALKQITPMTMDQIVSSFRYEDIQALRFMLPLFSGMPMRSQAGWDEAQEEIRMQKVEDSSDPKVAKEKVEKKAKDLDVLIEYNRKQAKYHGK